MISKVKVNSSNPGFIEAEGKLPFSSLSWVCLLGSKSPNKRCVFQWDYVPVSLLIGSSVRQKLS